MVICAWLPHSLSHVVELPRRKFIQGTLAGYEAREYLLEKWKRACAYCGKQNIPLQVEHIIPRARGGANMREDEALRGRAAFFHPHI